MLIGVVRKDNNKNPTNRHLRPKLNVYTKKNDKTKKKLESSDHQKQINLYFIRKVMGQGNRSTKRAKVREVQ